ncbi:MAG TPA: hypothetical protein VNT03_08975, partial [Baekduia sp.]|nr:hypothetical protein [Baekduia sp.]
ATLAACGDDGGGAASAADRASTPAALTAARGSHYLGRHALALAVGNGFRARLDQLAVMQQPPEGATDLGQDLPTGLVRDVRCAPAGGATAPPTGGHPQMWRCRVRWETVAGALKTTNYSVRSLATGCFAAGATPRLPEVKDPTIASYSEHPLNTVISLRKGC